MLLPPPPPPPLPGEEDCPPGEGTQGEVCIRPECTTTWDEDDEDDEDEDAATAVAEEPIGCCCLGSDGDTTLPLLPVVPPAPCLKPSCKCSELPSPLEEAAAIICCSLVLLEELVLEAETDEGWLAPIPCCCEIT